MKIHSYRILFIISIWTRTNYQMLTIWLRMNFQLLLYFPQQIWTQFIKLQFIFIIIGDEKRKEKEMAHYFDSSSSSLVPPLIVKASKVDLEAGNVDQIQCRICLESHGEFFDYHITQSVPIYVCYCGSVCDF